MPGPPALLSPNPCAGCDLELHRALPDGRLALRSVAGIGSGDGPGLTSTGTVDGRVLETLRGLSGRGFMTESNCCNVVCRGLIFFFLRAVA